MTDDFVRPVLDVHLRGAFNVTRPAWRFSDRKVTDGVINTSSAAGVLGNFGQSKLRRSQGRVVGLTYVLALEGAKFNYHRHAIAPLLGLA